MSGDLGDVSCDNATEGDTGLDDLNEDKIQARTHSNLGGRGGGEGRGQNVERGRGQDAEMGCSQDVETGCGQELLEGRVKVVDPESGEAIEVTVSLPSQELVQDIMREMWRYCHAYHISNSVRK